VENIPGHLSSELILQELNGWKPISLLAPVARPCWIEGWLPLYLNLLDRL
jgi:hypothetical protein